MRSFGRILNGRSTRPAGDSPAPLGGTRAQAVQRLQIGIAGLAAMVLMIALASVIMEQANRTEATSVPQAAATVAAESTAAPQTDPLADAGVVPDMPAEPTPTPSREQAILPEQGDALRPR
jgi:hypothetical protein